ncbi:hypothetical protein FW755_11065 [Lonepinella koalarum]|uniref:Uncharacterized protein n=1 Tax=Lonepinella koalarum TaxID=53417 RepID=A0A4V2PTW5_9PAST|nr:hypothetical protein [Lonepinella koalarum]MDH2927229.1 hypothetical protein [Lonepinella koalarum]TCK68101.1 hypothetical protein EV692_1800 [Lonepinella koalarum]TFJ89498.1 hypothetical protein E0709_08985 [Lonepinella koalarum]TYG33466.1 hypothetical protein FW755_11065 [Lonepinella koalarum]
MTVSMQHNGNGLNTLAERLAELKAKSAYVGLPVDDNPFVDGSSINMATLAAVLEFGNEHIPSRPFLRQTLAENQQKYTEFLTELIRDGLDAETAYGRLAEMVVGDVRSNMVNGSWTPNAKATIKRKGSSKPLIDTGKLRQSIRGIVK